MIDIIGWIGSALVAMSLLQKKMLNLRIINLAACVICVGYNWYIAVWPMVGMNAIVGAINVYFLAKMLRARTLRRRTPGTDVPASPEGASSEHV